MPLSKSLHHIPRPPIKGETAAIPLNKGIVTILTSDSEKNRPPSLRRTLSADMSSKKWLEQKGMKKIASSEQLMVNDSSSFSSLDEEFDRKNPSQDRDAIWATILTQKKENFTPYVHPLAKRSSSGLSDKSLEICTENLGSETGSDLGFYSYPSLEILSDHEDDHKFVKDAQIVQENVEETNPFENLKVAKYKKSPARPFPPPLSSISKKDGALIHVNSRRENGRLVLEAVSVPQRNNFQTQRLNGRLVLTMVSAPNSQESHEVEELEVNNNVAKKVEFFIEQNSKSSPSVILSVPKSNLMMKKLMGLRGKNPTWSHKGVNLVEVDRKVVEETPLAQTLPPLSPRVARLIQSPPPPAATFNRYEYFWRNNKEISDESNEEVVVIRGTKDEYLVPYLRGCNKDPKRRSLLIWEPYCIATT